ncbi:hypothetical protein [Pyrodictium abyssi]|uniref:Uncharacterized protein n=1 Tax=Pyrodictium abyssi TaxID=54256 RepID=A0ABN6ZQ13_9CREN|nr:hypothetical protein PABY_00350 [Pyrodictium abyssi]
MPGSALAEVFSALVGFLYRDGAPENMKGSLSCDGAACKYAYLKQLVSMLASLRGGEASAVAERALDALWARPRARLSAEALERLQATLRSYIAGSLGVFEALASLVELGLGVGQASEILFVLDPERVYVTYAANLRGFHRLAELFGVDSSSVPRSPEALEEMVERRDERAFDKVLDAFSELEGALSPLLETLPGPYTARPLVYDALLYLAGTGRLEPRRVREAYTELKGLEAALHMASLRVAREAPDFDFDDEL